MPNFTRTYTDAQCEAVIAARLDDRLTAKQVVEAAARGDLADGPFRVPIGTIYRVGREGAREREAQRFLELARRDPNQAKDELVARQLDLLNQEMTRLEQANELDIEALQRLVRLTAAIGKADRTTIARTQPLYEPQAPSNGLAELIREAHEQSPPTEAPSHTTPNGNGHQSQQMDARAPEPEPPRTRTGNKELDRLLSQEPAVRQSS